MRAADQRYRQQQKADALKALQEAGAVIAEAMETATFALLDQHPEWDASHTLSVIGEGIMQFLQDFTSPWTLETVFGTSEEETTAITRQKEDLIDQLQFTFF